MAKNKNNVNEASGYTMEEINAAKRLNIVIKEQTRSVEATEKRDKIFHILWMIMVYGLLTIGAVVVLLPFYWMLITSLKNPDEIRNQITYYPHTVMWSNYSTLFVGRGDKSIPGNYTRPFPFFTYLGNTLLVALFTTAGTLITSVLAAYAFAKMNFTGKNFLFALFIGTMMIPGEMMVITNYITVAPMLGSDIGVIASMIIPFIASVYYIYLLRQNMKQIPNELYYAAKVDGKSDWEYLWKVMVPLCKGTLVTIAILKLMGTWNSYVWPNLVANTDDQKLITNGLRTYGPTYNGDPDQGVRMAATVIVTVPLLFLFIFGRKYIMRGVGRAGIKG